MSVYTFTIGGAIGGAILAWMGIGSVEGSVGCVLGYMLVSVLVRMGWAE